MNKTVQLTFFEMVLVVQKRLLRNFQTGRLIEQDAIVETIGYFAQNRRLNCEYDVTDFKQMELISIIGH